tara:strand:- start:18 stop:443 length:426 start_codon:yes stop_codon:yes gene_type:complete
METKIHGSCLCGNVASNITPPFQRFYQCYCDRCQKKTGSAFAALIFGTPESIHWLSGEESIKRFDLPNAERFSNCFCTNCGSQVPYLSRDGAFLVVPAGYLDDDPIIRASANIFWEEKPCWFEENQQVNKFERYPPPVNTP